MGRMGWSMKRRLRVLFSVIMADGAVLGAALGIMCGGMPGAAAPSVIRTDSGIEISPKQAEQKYIALTFDDGPHKEYTPVLLEGLKSRGVKATFFLMGENICLLYTSTVAVLIVSVILGIIIALLDFIIKRGLSFII